MHLDRPLRALGWYLAACTLLTLGPLPSAPLDLLVSAAQAANELAGGSPAAPTHLQIEAVANVVLFVPIGFLLGRAVPRRSRWWLLGAVAAGSAMIELAQHTVLTSRYANLRDLALNSLGGAIGLLVAGRRSHDPEVATGSL